MDKPSTGTLSLVQIGIVQSYLTGIACGSSLSSFSKMQRIDHAGACLGSRVQAGIVETTIETHKGFKKSFRRVGNIQTITDENELWH